MVFMEEDVGRKEYQMPEQAFSSEEDALRAAAKKTNLRSQLLSFCQVSERGLASASSWPGFFLVVASRGRGWWWVAG